MIGKKKLTISFSLNWLLLIYAFALALIAAFIFGPANARPALVFAAAVLAAAATLTNALNGIETRSAQAQKGRITGATEYIDKWNAPAFYYCKKAGREAMNELKGMHSAAEQTAYITETADRQGNLTDLINQLESLSIAVQKEIVDEETVKQFFRSIVIQYWHNIEGYIKKRRAERDNPRLYREFEWLYERWKG